MSVYTYTYTNMKKRKSKICLVSSCGGHFMELIQLLPLVENKQYYIITEKNVASTASVEKHPHHYLVQQERGGMSFIFKFCWNILLSFIYFIIERPTTVITTGAGASYPTCLFARLFKCRIIYVESFAKLDSKSVTGKMLYPFADYFFVQWPEMKKVYPKAIYSGSVY